MSSAARVQTVQKPCRARYWAHRRARVLEFDITNGDQVCALCIYHLHNHCGYVDIWIPVCVVDRYL